MGTRKAFFLLLGLICCPLWFATAAHAECGGNQQCIGVSIEPSIAPAHGTPEISAPLAFGDQDVGTTSTSKPILVGAVLGPVGTRATLNSITLGGANAGDFQIASTTCTVGSPSLLHNGAVSTPFNETCTISVEFNPGTVGAKAAMIDVSTNAITRTIPLTGTGILPPPVITSALATSGATGEVFPGYQITASNNPTSYGATGLPPGLSVNTATGVISGTPTADGTYNSTISATNAAGTTDETLVFTISANAPVITSATSASGTTGAVFPGYQITATNNPSSFGASGLPPGLGVNTASGLISGTPAGGGSFDATVTATNATGTASQVIRFTITGAAPTSQDAMVEVPLNSPTSIDLAPFITGAGITGIRITVAAAHGTLATTGTVVTYAPVTNYFGPDQFSYVATNSDGESMPAVVSLNVVGRPDPSADPDVRSLIRSQMDTAIRYSRSQISNFQRRMEMLHSGRPNRHENVARVDTVHPNAAAASPGQDNYQSQGSHEAAPTHMANGSFPSRLASTLFAAVTTQSVELSGDLARTDDSSWLPEGIGVWIGGNLQFGTRNNADGASSLRFTTDGLSVGVDRWFSDALVLGIGLGYAHGTTDIGTDGTENTSEAWSVSAYGSYQPTENIFIDGLIGYGELEYDADRYVASVDAFARSERDGEQVFGSIAAGYEFRTDALLISPYGRFDFALNSLDRATETGAGLNALTYFDRDLDTGQLSLGLRAESRHEMNFGWVVPRLRVEYKHDFEQARKATIAYADELGGGPRYSTRLVSSDNDTLLISVGSDFDFDNGMKLGIDYQSLQASGPDEVQAFGLWLSKEFDHETVLWGPLSTKLFKAPVRVEAAYTWDDNLNRDRDAEDAETLSDHVYSIDVRKSAVFPVTSHTRLMVNGNLNGTKLRKHDGLDRFGVGLGAEFQYRTSGSFFAPTFGVMARLLVDEYDSDIRSGYRYSFGVNARQSLTDRIGVFAAVARNVREADSGVFETKDYAARVNFDYSLGRRGMLYVGGEYRRGDTVTSSNFNAYALDVAEVLVPDGAYHNRQLTAYRYEAETWLWTLGYNWFLGPRDSIDFSWRGAESSPTDLPADGTYTGTGSTSYSINQLSVAYLMRF